MSEKECAMLHAVFPGWEAFEDMDIGPVRILEQAARHCFLEDKKGPAVDSLRRCLLALREGGPWRMTPEYEALIQLT